MSNFITQIQEAEKEAQVRVEEAQKKAEMMIESAQKEAGDYNEGIFKEVSGDAQSQLDKAKEEATRAYNQALATYSSGVLAIESKAKSHAAQVVDACFALILKKFKF